MKKIIRTCTNSRSTLVLRRIFPLTSSKILEVHTVRRRIFSSSAKKSASQSKHFGLLVQVLTTLCTAALLISCTGCARKIPESDFSSLVNELENENSDPESTSENSDSAPENSDSVSESTPENTGGEPESAAPESAANPQLEMLIKGFALDEIPLPDGTTLKKTDAVDGFGNPDYSILKFDVGVMRYAKPVFQTNLDDPDSFDWDNYTFKETVDDTAEDRVVVVRAGDVLENGMTVKSAGMYFEVQQGEPGYKQIEIELEGEQTAEGVIYLREEDDYGIYKDHLEMYIDTTKCENLPMRYNQYGSASWTYTFPDHKIAMTVDGCFYDLGDINEIDVDVSEVFLDSRFAKVKVTFKDPVLLLTEAEAVQVRAELVDIEVL